MSKSRRGKSASANELSRWETELIQAPFTEGTWSSCVFFVVPNKADDNVFIETMSEVVATGVRKLFSIITYEGLIKDVKEFGKGPVTGGKGKGAASAKPPQFHEVCEQVKPLVDQGEVIPPTLMAKLLKFKLLQIKQKDLERREEEKKAAKAAEAAKKDEKGKKSGRSPSAGKRSKSPGKKKGKKEADIPPSPKKDTKLKRRGDVEDTFKTIDDEPDDEGSPHHYVLIQGILTASVISNLIEVGVNVDALICLKAENYDSLTPTTHQKDENTAAKEDDVELLERELVMSEEVAQRLEQEALIKAFWAESQNIVKKAASGHKLKDVAKYEVRIKDSIMPKRNLQELEAEKKVEFGTAIFEGVADVCYNMLDHWEQYKHYLNLMKLIHVPVHLKASASALVIPPAADPLGSQSTTANQDGGSASVVIADADKRYYDHLISSVPPESHSVPLILHCLLEQVVATVDETNPLDQVVPPRQDGLSHDLAAYISCKTSKLALPNDGKQAITEPIDTTRPQKLHESPVILQYGDGMTSRLHDLVPANGLDPQEAEKCILDLFPQTCLKELPQLDGQDLVEREARASELYHFCKSRMSSSDSLEHILKQFAFEGMLLKVADHNGDVVDLEEVDESFKFYSNLWDHPYSKLSEFQALRFPNEDLEIKKLANDSFLLTSFRNLDEWCFVEHFDPKTMIQVLEAARLAYPYMDTYYHKRDHTLLLALHNPVGASCDSRSKLSWSTKLHSNVGFKNYLEHVVSSIGDWIQEQERIREEAARTPTPPPPAPEQPSVPLKIGSRYGLMTRQEVALIKAEEEEKNKKKGKKSARGSRSPKRSAKTREKSASPEKKDDKDKKRDGSASSRQKSATGRSPSAKGSRSIKSATSKRGLQSRSRSGDLEEPEIQPVDEPVEKSYSFIGYDTGDNLIHVSGSLMTVFPADGGQIQVNKSQYVQGARKVSTSVFKDGNMFVLHFLEPIDEILTKEELEGLEEKDDLRIDKNEKEEYKNDELEKSEIEASEKEQQKIPKGPKPFCDFSSFVAELSDGMVLALSSYGPSGSFKEKESKESEETVTGYLKADTVMPPQPTPSPQPKAGSPKARKRAEEEAKRMEEIQQQQEEERLRLEEEARRKAEEEKLRKPFQHVFITCPDGQHVQYLNDDCYKSSSSKGGVVVRQSYPIRPLGSVKEKPASEEISRTIMTDGTVIRLLTDGSVQVLFPDGAISKCESYPMKKAPFSSKPGSAVARQDPSITAAKRSVRGPGTNPKPLEEPLVPAISLPDKVPVWSSTGVDGSKVLSLPEGGYKTVNGLHCSTATCPQSGQVLKTREDNVVIIERLDGTRIVEHADGTRLTTFYKKVEQDIHVPDNEAGEQGVYSDVTKMFVKVECIGFPTLVFDRDLGSCETIFGNGTKVDTQADGVCIMYRPDGSQLHIEAKGIVSYYGRDTQNLNKDYGNAKAPTGVYVMRTANQLCFEMTDERGTHFTVLSNGRITVDKEETESTYQDMVAKPDYASNEKKERLEPGPLERAPVSPIVPRFFVIHADGSGSELLRSVDVQEFLKQAEDDPLTAVLRSPLEGHADVTGITIVKPYSGGTGKIWLKEKDEGLIIPPGLRERDFKMMSSREVEKPGPVFGTNAGSGLSVGSRVKPTLLPNVNCPRVLEFRQLIQYKPLTLDQRQQMVKAIQAYSDYLEKRQTGLDYLLPRDPRNESEKLVAEELEDKVRFHESADYKVKAHGKQGILLEDEILNTAEAFSGKTKNRDISRAYVDEITPDPVLPPPPPKWKRSLSEWERDQIELAELDYGKHALRYKEVPPYFETRSGQEFLKGIHSPKVPDMEALTSELANQTRHPPPGESSPAETPEIVVHEESATSDCTGEGSKIAPSPDVVLPATSGELSSHPAGEPSATPNGIRPTNPTPAHATGNGTPTPVRPTNPTPSQAFTTANPRPSNPTPRQASEPLSQDSPLQGDSPQWRNNLESVQEVDVPSSQEERLEGPIEPEDADGYENGPVFSVEMPHISPRSLYFDVTGETRKAKVKLPSCIKGSKPGALPNSQFYEIEDPVRRRVHTVSVTGGDQQKVENLRGFELLPPQVSFGVLKEGCTYVHSVLLKNVGIDSCRYKIKQPPPSTGLRILYQPGPVAAGMNSVLDVEIFAVAVGVVGDSGLGHVGHHVEIVTETDILYLPVTATIMTVYEYEIRYGDTEEGLVQGTHRVPNRPPSRDPTRPRKEGDYAVINTSV